MIFFFFFKYFLAFYGFINSTAEEGDRKQGEREGGPRPGAKGPRPGVEPGSAAKPQHIERPLYQVS